VVIGSPFDVIKSRIMNGREIEGKKVPYASIGECVSLAWKENGVMAFYKGFAANCQRLVSWNVCMFLLREQI